jgi:hypothetical protein
MAHPYLVLEPGAQADLDVLPYFKGFTKSPQYSIEGESTLVNAAISGSTIHLQAGNDGGIAIFTMKVQDSEGTTHEKRFSVAVTGNPNAIHKVWSEDDIQVVKREFFTLGGRQVYELHPQEIYVMRLTDTDTDGNVHSVKIIK